MDKDVTGGSASTSEGSAQTSQNLNAVKTADTQDDSSTKPKTPSFEELQKKVSDLERYKDDMFRYKDEAKKAKDALEANTTQSLKDKDDYKSLYESEVQLRKSAETSLSDFSDGYFHDKKFSEVRALALRAGIRQEAEKDLELLDLSKVQVEKTDQGRTLVHGADTFVEELKRTSPHWFKASNNLNINTRGGGAPPAEPDALTARYMVDLERKDYQRYKELLPKFNQQLAASKRAF